MQTLKSVMLHILTLFCVIGPCSVGDTIVQVLLWQLQVHRKGLMKYEQTDSSTPCPSPSSIKNAHW